MYVRAMNICETCEEFKPVLKADGESEIKERHVECEHYERCSRVADQAIERLRELL